MNTKDRPISIFTAPSIDDRDDFDTKVNVFRRDLKGLSLRAFVDKLNAQAALLNENFTIESLDTVDHQGRVFIHGGRLSCLDLKSGKELWQIYMLRE